MVATRHAVSESPARDRRMSRGRVLRAYCFETKYELYRLLRTPSFAVPAVIFPVLFYALFVVLLRGPEPDPLRATYMFATYGVFGAMAPGLFGFGVTVAFEREQRLFVLKRALPMPAASYLIARMLVAMLFVAVVFATLAPVAVLGGGVRLGAGQLAALAAVDILGVLPFCTLGLYIGTLVSGHAAQGIVNLVYLPMAFLSGLWIPLASLPPLISALAPVWPSYHLAQIALRTAGQGADATATHVAALAGFTLVFFALARRRLSRMSVT